MPIVSVIVPNYNHGQYLRKRIDSILSQTFQDFELILLDDASTDDSREVIESYRNDTHVTHIVYNENNGGTPFKQWDKGIELAAGEWIWIAESDDFADKCFLETLIEKVQRYPEVGFAFSTTFFVNEDGKVTGKSRDADLAASPDDHCVHESKAFIKERIFINNSIDNVSECIFKKILYSSEKKHLYEWMRLCGDWFFYVLLSQQTNVLEVYKPLSYYRKHSYNTVISTEHQGKTFIEGIEIYKYITRNVLKATNEDYREMAKYWLDNKRIYNYSADTNNTIKRLFMKEFPVVVVYYYMFSFKRSIKKVIKR